MQRWHAQSCCLLVIFPEGELCIGYLHLLRDLSSKPLLHLHMDQEHCSHIHTHTHSCAHTPPPHHLVNCTHLAQQYLRGDLWSLLIQCRLHLVHLGVTHASDVTHKGQTDRAGPADGAVSAVLTFLQRSSSLRESKRRPATQKGRGS